MERKQIAHALVIPYPSQGHINPMLQFCKRIVSKGVKVTIANTIQVSKSMNVNSSSKIDLETISDGFDEAGYYQAENPKIYFSTFAIVGSKTLSNLIKKINENSENPVTFVIYDGFLTWVLDVAKEFGLTSVVFFTQSCAVSNIYYHVHKGLLNVPLSDYSDISLPGMPLMDGSETPSFVYDPKRFPFLNDVLVNQFSNFDQADWILQNSFCKLEEEVINWMTKKWKLRTIGPTIPSKYLDKRIEDDEDYGINLFAPNSTACMNWLNTKPNGSVIYISFGSLAMLGLEEMEELAYGLKQTNYKFFWVVRESEQSKLPKNFIEEISKTGNLVVSWCQQLEVLEHKAIGCFVTHCGFNSVLEALSLGVPMVGMPHWSDQPTNAKYIEDVWKIGIRVKCNEKGIVGRETIEACIKEIMEGEKGKEIKKNARNWSQLAKEAIDEGGSSDKNINEFIDNIIKF